MSWITEFCPVICQHGESTIAARACFLLLGTVERVRRHLACLHIGGETVRFHFDVKYARLNFEI